MKIFPRIMRRALSALLKNKEGNPRPVPSAMEVVTNIMSFPLLLETQLDKWASFTLNNKSVTTVITSVVELIKNRNEEVVGFQKDGFTVFFEPCNNKRNINVFTIVAHKDELCRKLTDYIASSKNAEEGKSCEDMTHPSRGTSINTGQVYRPQQDHTVRMSHNKYLSASTAGRGSTRHGLSPHHETQTTWSKSNELVLSMTLPSTFVQLSFLTEFRENLDYFMKIAREVKSHAVHLPLPLPPPKIKEDTPILVMVSLHDQASLPSMLCPKQ